MKFGTMPGTPAGVFMPHGFNAYLRILHPAGRADSDDVVHPVRWHEIADLSGAVMHPLVQFENVVARLLDTDESIREPDEGEFFGESCAALCEILQTQPNASGQCVFAFWDGWGAGLEHAPLTESIEIGLRSYKIGYAPLSCACEFPFSPAFWWPPDRSWLVATDIDMNSTLIGCDRIVADQVLADTRFEAFEISREWRIDKCGDQLNT